MKDLTGVEYNVFHDGAFWKRWWEKNKTKFPEDVQNIKIPELPKTAYGKVYVSYPVEIETLAGQLLLFQYRARQIKNLPSSDPLIYHPHLFMAAQSIAGFKEPMAIPYLIAIVDADSCQDDLCGGATGCLSYIAGWYGLSRLIDIRDWDKSRKGEWWKKWWEENKKNYPEAVQNIPIPSIHDEWFPELNKEFVLWYQKREEAEKPYREKMVRRSQPDADLDDIPSERLSVEGNKKMEYFLIGVNKDKPVPESGYRLVIVMPGGDGSADFHPFVCRIWKYAMSETPFIVAQPIAVRWNPLQQIVWATEKNKVFLQGFSTEKFVESVIADVSKRVKVDPNCVFTLSWSSSGPAAYSIALQEKTAVTGSYIVMSVFNSELLPPLEKAKDRLFAIQHSPDDRVCPFRMAKDAEKQLTEHGAVVKFTEYPGGHGWHGNIWGLIRENLDWLVEQRTTSL
jgi:predicted esterase